MNGNHNRRRLLLATLLSFGITSAPAQAEDIDVFFTKSANAIAPNVLFVLDSSDSMKATSGGKSRMQDLKDSLNKVLLPTPKYKKLNVGIMDFGGSRSGGIDFPISAINDPANSVDSGIPAAKNDGTPLNVDSALDYIAKSYTTSNGTPMGDALYFASSYFSGAQVFNSGGWRSPRNKPNTWDTTTNSYTGGYREADNPAAYTGTVGYTDTPETRVRDCSPSSPRPIRQCGTSYHSCKTETHNTTASPGYCRVQQNQRTCDTTGLECSDHWTTISTTSYDGSNRPTDPDGSGSLYRVRCTNPQTASSYTFQRCEEDYIYNKRTWDPAATYKTPITQQCQSNYVVLLSDGEPTKNYTRNYIASRARSVIGSGRPQDCADVGSSGSNIRTYGRCLPELVQYMAEYDQSPLSGDQTISTYTIGFMLGGNTEAKDFLTLLADKSKAHGQKMGEYFSASKSSDLVNIFKKIIKQVTASDVSFAAPAVSIDQSNRLATSEYVYRTEFTPSDKPRWNGDVIKSKVDPTSASGFTDDPITLASTLVAGSRKMVTVTGSNFDLNATENAFKTTNTSLVTLLKSLHTGSSAVDPTKLIPWTLGTDVQDENGDNDTTDERKHMGDSLHTTPAMVTYTPASGTKQQVLYVPTNEGLLHAFDVSGSTPTELFAFIPKSLLTNLDTLYRNSNTDKKVYGLDGNLAIWQDGNKVTLYFGMRRGGRDYYALDVSDPTQPRLLWHIEGGKGDFTELGQTWSKPQITNVMVSGTETLALVFGGGYDAKTQDDTSKTTRTDDSVGRSVFIVNAETGAKIWSAGLDNSHDVQLSEMKNSIPSNVRIIDLDGNHGTRRADRLYVGDTGGRVWRIDLDQTDISNSSGYQLADFNDGTAAGNRRFYYAPSIAFDRKRRLMISIGSGYRAHPDETATTDRFYVFEDKDATIGSPTTTPTALNETKLGDVTNDLTGQAAFAGNVVGWRLDMDSNEKVLAESVIFNNKVVFTTYQPIFAGGNTTCNNGSTPRAYALALEDGRPVIDLDPKTTGTYTLTDRFKELSTVQFIPGSPYVTINKKDNSSNQTNQPLGLAADVYEAGLYADGDLLLKDGFMSERISWQNQ